MEGETYYIYILKLTNGGFYVGSTKNLELRLRLHFNSGGAVATKEYKPVCIINIYSLVDYKIGSEYAHSIAEILIANKLAVSYGYHKVRGAKHGKGWHDTPSPSGWKTIIRLKKMSTTENGIYLRAKLTKVPTNEYPTFKVRSKINKDRNY